MSDLVPPMDAEDAFEASYVKGLQSLDMATILTPNHTIKSHSPLTFAGFCSRLKAGLSEQALRWTHTAYPRDRSL